MSIFDNFNYVKNQLGTDARILENAFRLDSFYRKYKYVIWVVIFIFVIVVVSMFSYFKYKESNAVKYSNIYFRLLDDKDNSVLLDELKSGNPNLYYLFMLNAGIESGNLNQLEQLSNISGGLVSNVASYYLGSFDRNASSLEKIDGKFMSDFTNIQRAYILLKNGKYDDARTILINIPEDSSLLELAKLLLNYVVVSK